MYIDVNVFMYVFVCVYMYACMHRYIYRRAPQYEQRGIRSRRAEAFSTRISPILSDINLYMFL